MKNYNLGFFLILLFIALSQYGSHAQSTPSSQKIVDKCINAHGSKEANKSAFAFDFRKYSYTYEQNNGMYTYSRTNKETGVKDVLTNDGLKRFNEGQEIILSEKDKSRFGNSVNSVIYFAFLPYFLNDAAVNKKYIGSEKIDGEDYYKIRVTFTKEGGGDDFEDVYVYWISEEEYTIDYLAYSFHVNGGGVRFRRAYNPRRVEGVLFQDYVNYKHSKTTPVESLGAMFEQGKLEELSKIVLENVRHIDSGT